MSPSQASETCASASSATSANYGAVIMRSGLKCVKWQEKWFEWWILVETAPSIDVVPEHTIDGSFLRGNCCKLDSDNDVNTGCDSTVSSNIDSCILHAADPCCPNVHPWRHDS